MEQQREAYNLIVIFLLTIVSIHDVSSSSQNLYTITTTIDIGSTDDDKITDRWSQPSDTTTSIYQDITTYLPASTSVQAEETLDSSETNALNRFARPSHQHNEHTEDDNPEEPPDHVIPYSVHEEARDVPTQPKYVAPGIWAKPPPEKDIPLDFVPTKLHAQVRGSHTVKRLPQQQAIESAETDEERRNAPRLREVVTNSKVNTVYTEEGYEDSAYDHAGHVRDADFHEGFARKLHDQKKSGQNSSNNKNKNLMSDKFKEYDEDYQDYLQENRKFEEADDEDNLIGYDDRNSWEESEINPKYIAENNIQKLEEDIEKDAEEAERSSEIYQNEQESKLRNDFKDDSSESEESHVENNLKHEDKPVKRKKKKVKVRHEKNDNASEKTKQPRKRRRKLYLGTTVFPYEEASLIDVETPARPHGFVINSPNSQIYSIDRTSYIAPFAGASFQQIDEPTTVSYSQIFWDYFKAKQGPSTTESSTLVSNPTTMNPQQETQTPIAVATIDGHGPYLFVTNEETMTSPPQFVDSLSYDPQNLFSDHVEFGPASIHQTHSRHLLGQSDGVDYVNNVIATSTVATFTSVPSLSPEGVEYTSSTALLDNTVSNSTPTVMTINFTQEAYARLADYYLNPFLAPILDNSNIAVPRNKLKYKVVARAKPDKKSIAQSSQQQALPSSSREETEHKKTRDDSHEKKFVKSVTLSPHEQVLPSSSKEENEYKKIRNELKAKYNKMLSYVKNKQETQSFPKEKKIFFPEDFTLRRPPVQRAAYSIFLTDHPSANRSSISNESESSREANWKSDLQNQHRSQSVKLPFRFFDPFAPIPIHPVYRKNAFPTTKLLPPPLSLASTYVNYRGNKQNDNHHSHLGGKLQQRRNNPFRYFSLHPEASWRTRSRRKRSDEGEFHDGGDGNATDVDVKATTNNGMTNDSKTEQRDKSLFDMVIDRSEGKLSSRRVIDASIVVSDAMKLAIPTRSREDKSGTFRDKNSTNGERKNTEDEKEMIIDISKMDKKGPIQSATQNGRTNDMDIVESAKKKRDIRSEKYLIKNLKSKVSKKNHEELLNESPKVSSDVVDEEIAARFNNEKDNETSPINKENGKVEVEIPSFDYVEELVEGDPIKFSTTTEAAIDLKKYPFYKHADLPSASALKYIVDPRSIPRKTARGMEFYDSRNAYKQCAEVEPDLDEVLPEKEEPDSERGLQEDLPRLRGLGDKLDCFKAKYFDENPLDNPLFAEKVIEAPTPPTELNPTKFASKIMVFPEENDEYVVPQVSKRPERNGRQQWRNRIRPYETLESIRVNYKHDPQTGRGRNAYLHTVRDTRLPNTMRRVKNRKSRPRITTTTPSLKQQNASYQNQVYEDVMGNIRNMKNTYQVYETTLPPFTQLLETAGSENTLKVANDTSKEKSTSRPDITDVTNNTRLSEIKGLVPPPKYVTYRPNYRKHRPLAKSRASFIRSPTLPRIIAHHHAIKINKRSTTDDTKNTSESTINEDKKATVNGSTEVDAIKNDTLTIKLIEKVTNETNVTSNPLDLEIEESRPIGMQDRRLSSIVKTDDKKKRRNSMSSDLKSEPQKITYTIRDRIRHSKPKWDTRGFGKFTASPKTADEDSRRKEPRYNPVERKKKPVDDRQNNSTIMNSTESTSGIESAMSLIEDRESGTTEVYHAEESAVQQTVYRKKDEYPEVENAENIDTVSKESSFEEDEEESTTNTYQVRENVNENASTTTRSTDFPNSKEILNLQEYLESDPPGYAETFSEEVTKPSNKHQANANHESEGTEEKQEEKADYPGNSWDSDSSEKTEEQIETPIKTKLFFQDEEDSSKEEEGSNKDETFFTPSSIESNKDENATFYKPFPYSGYKSKFEKESDENNSEEEIEEKSEDYVFPWHADKESKESKRWLHSHDRYEYPWEMRDRLARERRRRKQAKARIFDDEDEEESTRYERPVYPWDRYDVPSNIHRMNTRRDLPRKYDDSKKFNTKYVPFTKYSSRYSSSDTKPSKFSNLREISTPIKKFLDDDDESKGKVSKETENPSSAVQKSSSGRKILKGTLVPEDITQPPRRKNARRKISQVGRNVTNNSRVDSKKLRNEDITNAEKEEEPAEYRKLKSASDDSELSTEVTSSQPSQLSDGTKEVPSATKQPKKRRRITKNNTSISLDNTSAGSAAKSTRKRRRKPETSTTTSATPLASVDYDPRESVFTSIRKRYSNKDDRSDFSEKTAVPKTSRNNFDNFQVEISTPKTRTIEHRSRVSKEKIITKTTYPNETENFGSVNTNLTSVGKKPVKMRIKLRRRKNNNKRNGDNEDSDNERELTKDEDKEKNYQLKFVNGDEIKKSFTLNEPQDKSRDDTFGIKKEIKEINDFSPYDEIVNDENDDNDNGDFGISSEIYAVHDSIQNVPPNRERNPANGRTESESNKTTKNWKRRNNSKEANEGKKKKDVEQKRRPLLQAKFIKDPEHRLYYYVERK